MHLTHRVGELSTFGPDDGWLDAECRRLLGFGRRIVHPAGGAAWLDDTGAPDLSRPVHTWITSRTVHVFGLGSLLGVEGCTPIATAALEGLRTTLHDDDHDGWFGAVDADGTPDGTGKSCYAHAFVMLAGSTAVVAGLPGAEDLLADATGVFLQHFWDEDVGRVVDEWDRAWSEAVPYRGLNSTMHSVEAMIAVGDVTGDAAWHARAARLAGLVVELAETYGGRLPEHFGPDWSVDLELNRDRPDDPFKPYGATVGHGLEWSRLLLALEASLGDDAPAGPARHPAPPLRPRGRGRVARRRRARLRLHHRLAGRPGRPRADALGGSGGRRGRCGTAPAHGGGDLRPPLRGVVGLRRRAPARHRAGLVAPRARPGQPPAGDRLAGEAGPVPRGPGDPAPAAAARPESRQRGGPVERAVGTGMMGA